MYTSSIHILKFMSDYKNGVPPTEYIERIGSVLIISRNVDLTYIGYCEKYGVWKFDIKHISLCTGRTRGTLSGKEWPERAYGTVGSVYGSLTVLKIEKRDKHFWAYCHCEKYDGDFWTTLKSLRDGVTISGRNKVKRRPPELILDDGVLDGYVITARRTEYKWMDDAIYYSVWYEERVVLVHRLVWELHHGCIPAWDNGKGYSIDFINRNTSDCRIANLRCVEIMGDKNIQMGNRRVSKKSSNFKGVSFQNKKWYSVIGVDKTRYYLGCFDNPIDAAIAYARTAEMLNVDGYHYAGHRQALDEIGVDPAEYEYDPLNPRLCAVAQY